jgi:hypothetical protein
MLHKRSSYSPPQHDLPPSPAKPFVDRHVKSYGVDGRSSNWDPMDPRQETHTVVKRTDDAEYQKWMTTIPIMAMSVGTRWT